MKPIHKFNGGSGATLCHQCSVIINTGLTDDLYCDKCKSDIINRGASAFYTAVTDGASQKISKPLEKFLKSLHRENTKNC